MHRSSPLAALPGNAPPNAAHAAAAYGMRRRDLPLAAAGSCVTVSGDPGAPKLTENLLKACPPPDLAQQTAVTAVEQRGLRQAGTSRCSFASLLVFASLSAHFMSALPEFSGQK